MTKNITREDISEYINTEFGLSKNDCNNLVKEIIEQIILGLINHSIVKVHNFGTFKIKEKNQRIGRNPKTKEEVMIMARRVISFIPSQQLLKKINRNRISTGMSNNEIKNFIKYYEKITRWMLNKMPSLANIVLYVNKNQKITKIKKN